MKILIVDDEELAVKRLQRCILAVEPEAEIHAFVSAEDMLAFAEKVRCDIAFLDIRGMDIDGITVAKRLKVLYPKLNIIFTTGYNEYAMDAIMLRASDYILKPITTEKVRDAMAELRYPIEKEKTGLWFKCFGNFEVFMNGEPVKFKISKTKELVAYLYDRKGALCSTAELQAVLWEDDANHANYLKQLRKDLSDTFEQYGLDNLIVKNRGHLGLMFHEIDSDLAEWDRGTASGLNAYQGEYMTQYSWAENTLGSLEAGTFQIE